jgi:hypothetical protein
MMFDNATDNSLLHAATPTSKASSSAADDDVSLDGSWADDRDNEDDGDKTRPKTRPKLKIFISEGLVAGSRSAAARREQCREHR